jgi:hypothetical protein
MCKMDLERIERKKDLVNLKTKYNTKTKLN